MEQRAKMNDHFSIAVTLIAKKAHINGVKRHGLCGIYTLHATYTLRVESHGPYRIYTLCETYTVYTLCRKPWTVCIHTLCERYTLCVESHGHCVQHIMNE